MVDLAEQTESGTDGPASASDEIVDVCVLSEGTYPFVSGGVSTWVHRLINAFPDLSFSILHLSPGPDSYDSYKYSIPDNVTEIREVYLFETHRDSRNYRSIFTNGSRGPLEPDEVYRKLYHREWEVLDDLCPMLRSGRITRGEILNSPASYRMIEHLYEQEGDLDVSFLHYFWINRFLLAPLLNLMSYRIPEAKLYHTVSAGYGGFLGVLANMVRKKPFLLTEHGIYLRERQIEINRARRIRERDRSEYYITEEQNYFKRLWHDFFQDLTKLIYRHAAGILTISGKNQDYQKKLGANPDKMRLIPNGVDVDEFDMVHKRPPEDADTPFRIALIGRIVPIKDVGTYIKAVKLLSFRDVDFHAYVTGPVEEEPEYVEKCKEWQSMLDLEEHLEFTGRKEIPAFFENVDLLVLTSVKEVVPLTILEANCVGIPVVTTRVGSCSELLRGWPGADDDIGPSGLLTEIGNPEQIADAVEKLYRDRELYEEFARNGRERVRRFFDWNDVIDEYADVYKNYLSEESWQAPGLI